MSTHPTKNYTYDQLYAELQQAVSLNQVRENRGEDGLALYCYTDQTVYERSWNRITMLARGLILDTINECVVATPFPKFFNYHEVPTLPQDLQDEIKVSDFFNSPFNVYEKLDGSLIIVFYHNGKWKCATKGSLASDQAKWAQNFLNENTHKIDMFLLEGCTYLAEAIYPENRIVVNYGTRRELVLLGAYDNEDGEELTYTLLKEFGSDLNWPVAKQYHYNSVDELIAAAADLPMQEEGWIIHSCSGQRIKIKGAEYCRVHRLVSNLTPLSIWRAMRDREDLELIRKSLPEEFWQDFDDITTLLSRSLGKLLDKIGGAASRYEKASDKEVGLQLHDFPMDVRSFIFPWRRHNAEILNNQKSRHSLYETIRPARNFLPGYAPSNSVVRAQENE
jgi:RNA ligase